MEVVPLSVGAASRAWDEQSLDADTAAGQIGGAATGGFTSSVSGAAARFTGAWDRHTAALAADAEAQADGLRVAIADYVATDEASGMEMLVLQAFLTEQR